ncbi:MAG: alpha/beta hydrolase [Bacteroidales bacterium]
MKKYIHFRGKKIFYSESGGGQVLILIHGYLETGESWNGFAKKLSDKFRVIVVDLPGHGNSDIYDEVHSMEFLATVLEGLLNALGIEKAFLVGHSLGGYAALAFVELFPNRLTGYCLFHSHPFADTPETLQKREREILIVKAGKKFLMYPDNVRRMFTDSNILKMPDALERAKRIASAITAEGITAVLNGMMKRPSRLAIMVAGVVPCLWILGSMDNYIPCEAMKERVKLPPNAELLILEKSGHLGFIEEEERSAEAITKFIARLTTH